MSGWLDGWTRVDNPRSGGGTMDPDGEGYPYRIVLHTIEGRNFPNLATHGSPPHLWYDPATRRKYQTVPLDRSAFALYQASDAPYYTNRARALQVELVGYAAEAGQWPDSYLVNIAQDVIVPLVRWVVAQGGAVDLRDPAVPLPGAIPNSAREDAPQRLAPAVWAFGPIGLCGHRHVPMGDDHWDCGALDLRRIAAYARELLGDLGGGGGNPPPKPPPVEDDDDMLIQLASDPKQGGDGTLYVAEGLDLWALRSDATRVALEQTGTLKPGAKQVHPATIDLYVFRGILEDDLGTLRKGPSSAALQAEIRNGYASVAASLEALGRKVDALAAAVLAGDGTASVDAETFRRVLREEISTLTLRPVA